MPFSSAKFLSAVSTRLHSRYGVRRFSRLHLNVLAVVAMSIAFIAGSYFTLSRYLLPMIRALSETTTSMPIDVAFDRLAAEGLAGYDNGGGLTWALESEVKLATNSGWWDVDYQYKTPVTLKNLSTTTLATASAQITVNTQELVTANKLLNTCADLEVVYASESGEFVRLPRSTIISSGATTCADSPATTVTFPLPSTLQSASSSAGLALYYGNDQATIPNTSEGYNILRSDGSSVSATLVCPFNGTTTCLNQNGLVEPTTATGAIRYSGGSAMSFDGKDDYLVTPTVNLSNSNYTFESWVKPISNPYGGLFTDYIGGTCYATVQPTGVSFCGLTGGITNDGGFHHIAIVYSVENDHLKIFVDGILKNEGTPAAQAKSLIISSIGRFWNSSTYSYKGLLDEVRISNVARYTSNFTPQTTPFEPDEYTKLLLHFDENGDDPRNTGKAIDSSGNGNHGTITGAKYVSGLVGVDNSASQTGAIPTSTYASHQGVFIEEGTTNLITNPSFENATSATLNWGTNYFNYATASATFTPSMAKRNSAGPFAAGVMVQGDAWNDTSGDQLTFPLGSQISGDLYGQLDRKQGTISFWYTPEFDSTGSTGSHGLFAFASDYYGIELWYNDTYDYFRFGAGNQSITQSQTLVAGSTYLITARWSTGSTLDGTNYLSLSVNDGHSFSATSQPSITATNTTIKIGQGVSGGVGAADGIIEGLTIYRRPLYDGQYGIDVGNGDEIAQIYNSGTGKDPTLVTGSWDVVFALPTNASTGALTTGTGNAWSHPHSSNLLYTSTTNTGGFMMAGDAGVDGWLASPQQISGLKLWLDAGSIMGLSDGDQVSSMTDLSGSGFHATQTISANKPIDLSQNNSRYLPLPKSLLACGKPRIVVQCSDVSHRQISRGNFASVSL